LRLFSFGDYGLALAALALVVFGAMPPTSLQVIVELKFHAAKTILLFSKILNFIGAALDRVVFRTKKLLPP